MWNDLPQLNGEILKITKHYLNNARFSALTTDIWTSRATQGFLTVTCHFFVKWQLVCAVLQTVALEEAHTADNIAQVLRLVAEEWGIAQKISAVVTDSGANIVAAVRQCNWPHVHCFAHTLNIIAQNSIRADDRVSLLQKKCRSIVGYFHRSTKASDHEGVSKTQSFA